MKWSMSSKMHPIYNKHMTNDQKHAPNWTIDENEANFYEILNKGNDQYMKWMPLEQKNIL